MPDGHEDILDGGPRRFLEAPVPTLEEYIAALHDLDCSRTLRATARKDSGHER